MNEQLWKVWEVIRKNNSIRDFGKGCRNALKFGYADFFPLDYSYNVGRKTAKESGKKYCIITLPPGAFGTFETWFSIANRTMIALKDGYIPAVDLCGYRKNLEWEFAGSLRDKDVNFWDVFFKQYQNAVSLKEIYYSEDYVCLKPTYKFAQWSFENMDYNIWKSYHAVYDKCGINDQILQNAEKTVLPEHTLGITIRRGMEWGMRLEWPLFTQLKGHHIRGFLETYERWIDENLARLGFDHFFLAADDRSTIEYFQKKYGDTCICSCRKQAHRFKGDVPIDREIADGKKEYFQEYTGERSFYMENEIGYISETCLLSKCAAILRNCGGQEAMARVISDRYMPMIDNDVFLDMYMR